MNLTIELPDELGAALKAQAHAHGLSPDRYVSRVLETTLAPEIEQQQRNTHPFETGYGMWAKYGPAPSIEEIEENRREMFRNFAQDF
jgi:plasmid stability protein